MYAYVFKPEWLEVLKLELELAGAQIINQTDTLFLVEHEVFPAPAFCIDIWPDVQKRTFESINQAAEILKKAGKIWSHYPISHVRRAELIQEKLRTAKKFSPISFPLSPELETHLRSVSVFSLLDQNQLIFCEHAENIIPGGVYEFVENKTIPPNRAYLKLWEALIYFGETPEKNNVCMDLGACPGGWTWVLQSFGSKVIAVDKAPLDKNISQLPGVYFLEQSAFALDFKNLACLNFVSQFAGEGRKNHALVSPLAGETGQRAVVLLGREGVIDLLVCDIACYPDKLLTQLLKWIESGKIKKIISTIKLQGQIDEKILEDLNNFKNIPNIKIKQLWQNKHELTLFWRA